MDEETFNLSIRKFLKMVGGKFNPTSIELDIKALTDYYSAIGFLAVQIKPEVRRSADMSHVTLVYHITEGTQYFVAGPPQVEGVKSIPTEQVEKLIDLKAGERFDDDLLNVGDRLHEKSEPHAAHAQNDNKTIAPRGVVRPMKIERFRKVDQRQSVAAQAQERGAVDVLDLMLESLADSHNLDHRHLQDGEA